MSKPSALAHCELGATDDHRHRQQHPRSRSELDTFRYKDDAFDLSAASQILGAIKCIVHLFFCASHFFRKVTALTGSHTSNDKQQSSMINHRPVR
ncbi:hypothetical protein EVAR_43128_1 [Eumeta japonica]|uniref:Uncharacterized protein n=1 Tax=Eumeta variegata TaxID=151549 RepID=A0A4C1XMK9_EUMVA|nr:hypothetical protein EVAR_43128_1 [Eumeta japonica]